ncbi:hypothetical protein GJ496_004346 [Pomphorhynchus laevis]|nr:hypothetical protein GJ496_004346 [Pomphorhynchus laevis]
MSCDGQSVKPESDSEQQSLPQKREGKIFVGGLTWDTTVDDVKAYFRRFGDIIDATIIKDPISGRSRGFGFVVFEEESTAKKVFSVDNHYINGKKVDTKNAFRRNAEPSCRKIFVGGLDPLLPENDIRAYFSKFGQIEEIDFPWDKEKNQRKAFCFVAFSSPDVVDSILKQSKHKLGDRMVDVKKATPKQDNISNANNANVALSLITQALSMNNNSNLNANNNLLASLLSSQQTPLNSHMSGLNANPMLPALAGLGYPVQAAANQQPGNIVSSSNPYFALAAAAAAGIYPPSSPSVDIASWYSNIALAAAAAASQDGHGIVPAMLHQGSHRDGQQVPMPHHHHNHHHAASNNGANGAVMGQNLPAASSGGVVGVYGGGKQSRSASNMSPNGPGIVGAAASVHRNAMQYHPYSR